MSLIVSGFINQFSSAITGLWPMRLTFILGVMRVLRRKRSWRRKGRSWSKMDWMRRMIKRRFMSISLMIYLRWGSVLVFTNTQSLTFAPFSFPWFSQAAWHCCCSICATTAWTTNFKSWPSSWSHMAPSSHNSANVFQWVARPFISTFTYCLTWFLRFYVQYSPFRNQTTRKRTMCIRWWVLYCMKHRYYF